MSATSSSTSPVAIGTAAGLVASALLDTLGGPTLAHRRYLLGQFLGIDLARVFDALTTAIDGQVRIASGNADVTLGTIGGTLIPYLVSSPQAAGTNQGSQGFAAFLRTAFTTGASSPRTLLVLDPEPVETVRTAAEDAGQLPHLGWYALCRRAGQLAPDAAAPFLAAVAADFARRTRPSAAALDTLAAFTSQPWRDSWSAASQLDGLGCYLADPETAADYGRLEVAAKWRTDIDSWTAPGEDLAARLARRLGRGHPAITKILQARGPFGIDYAQFQLADLLQGPPPAPAPLRAASPITIHRTPAAIAQGKSIAIWLPGGNGDFAIALTGTPTATDTCSLDVAAHVQAACRVEPGGTELTVELAGGEGWVFGELQLTSGPATTTLTLAIYCGQGSWFPIERSLAILPSAQSFAVEGDPEALAVAAGNRILGPAALEIPAADEGRPTTASTSLGGERHALPLLLLGAGGGGEAGSPGEGEGTGTGGDQGDGDGDGPDPEGGGSPGAEGQGGEGEAGGLPPAAESIAASPAHALIDAARRGRGSGIGALTFQASAGEAWMTVGAQRYRLPDQVIGNANGLELEAQILQSPDTWAFTLTEGAGGTPTLAPDPELERLSLASLDHVRLAAFREAREHLFAALAPSGSGHAVAAGVASPEATAYVSAYNDLLAAIPAGSRYQPEYDRLLLLDVVFEPATGDLLVAPTNPVTVGLMLAFWRTAASWVASGGDLPGDYDLAAVSPRHLLPLVQVGGEWHESLPDQPFPWRRYRRMVRLAGRPEHDPRFIASRIDFFLDVHPAYRDRRQRLAITFYDPGDGAAIAGALRLFYAPDSKATLEEEYTRPALDVNLVAGNGERATAMDDLLIDGEGSRPLDRLVRSRIRVTSIDRPAHPEFSHLSFVFRSPADRAPWLVRMGSRSATAYVGGLATAAGRATLEATNELAFAWGTFADQVCGDPGAPADSELLAQAIKRGLELVGGQPRELIETGATRMPTTRVQPGFLPEIYSRSVWVVHLDRLLGLEAFTPAAGQATRYLIDYEERADPTQPGLDAITATERVDAYLDALTRALGDLGGPAEASLARILRLLNAVSGKWALQLLHRSPGQLRERIGTVAAIAAVQELDGGFGDGDRAGVMVPLDEVFKALPRTGSGLPERPACDDLLYLSIPTGPGPTAVRGRLLEVKYRSGPGPDLATARAELEATRRWLQDVFNGSGPRALFRARDLAELIRTSSTRGHAFGLGARPGNGFEEALQNISSGNFSFDLEFWIGGDRLEGDVVSVELESAVPANRTTLPGAGSPLGMVRIGRPCLERLAAGRPLPRPATWEIPAFEPPAGQVPVPTPDPGNPGGGSPAPTATGAPSAAAEPGPALGADSAAEPARSPAARLADTATAEVTNKARELDVAALKYGLELEPFRPEAAQVGPSVIRFRTRALGKQTLAGVQRVALDLGREVGVAEGVLVDQEPYYLTVDVPRATPEVVTYADYARALDAPHAPGALPFLVGMAPSGDVRVEDLARLPHLLVAGATGSGKSVFLRGLVAALARTRGPDQFRLLLIDPKQVDFLPFEDLPHLMLGGILSDPAEAVTALQDMIEHEVSTRRPILKQAGVTSALEFYEAGHSLEELPQIVVLVDEFADLAATLDRENRAAFLSVIQRYGQLTRAFGIYLVLATQRPSVQVITGDIKANLTARVALKVQAPQDSVTILGRGGAERLRDRGDLMFDHAGQTERLQAFFATSEDARAVVARWWGGGR